VVRGAKNAAVIVDLPFGSYQESPQQAFRAAAAVMAQTGASGVKLEGGREMAETIDFLAQRGIPVLGHVGLKPQSVHSLGGYRARGRAEREAEAIMKDATAVAEAGAFALVVEGTVEPLARAITKSVPVPTIGIGASPACDGQILVTEDVLGLFGVFTPKFVKRYAELGDAVGRSGAALCRGCARAPVPGPGALLWRRSSQGELSKLCNGPEGARVMPAASDLPTVRTVVELRSAISSWRRTGETVALVPTMGALHAGHLSLLELAHARCQRIVVSLFINPTQFGPKEDYAAYPRDEAADAAKLAAAGADLLYAPAVSEMYPEGFATQVTVRRLTEHLCGPYRPGHFEGVATVVTKLLLQSLPDVAVFGEKDWQQLQVIRRLARDLDIPWQ
jgi:3-methyl-2-oxobutanoate hydroxymethyltransferase